MRDDIRHNLQQNHIDIRELDLLNRILLTTDGTLTDILEAYLLEEIQLVKLSGLIIPLSQPLPLLNLMMGEKILNRTVLLKGKVSNQNFVFATSTIALARIEKEMLEQLQESQTPLGRLWLTQRLETFKEIVVIGTTKAKELSSYFAVNSDDEILYRTYRVFSNKQPIMVITEMFPVVKTKN